MPTVGILAYGSLIEDPGPEIAAATARIESGVTTPFRVEFARTSTTRGGAPTLMPVTAGGAPVPAQIIVLKDTISREEHPALLCRPKTPPFGNRHAYFPHCKTRPTQQC